MTIVALALFSCTSGGKNETAGTAGSGAGGVEGGGDTGGAESAQAGKMAGSSGAATASAGAGHGGQSSAAGGGSVAGATSSRPPLTPDGPPYIGTGIELTQPPYDWTGIIGTGQSLSIGAYSTAVSLTQPYKNLMLIDNGPDPKYPIDGSASAQWAAVPLAEPHRPNVPGTFSNNLNYPNNIAGLSATGPYGETPHSGMANSISKAWAGRGKTDDYITTHSAVGVGGYCLQYIAKGTTSFAAALSEARVYKKLADAAGKVYGVGGVILTHGECDNSVRTPDYGEKVHQLWSDFNTDLKAVTQQPNNIVMLASQASSVKGAGYNSPAIQLWRAGRAHPGEVVCTGPKYAYGPYYVHLPGPGYERVGEKYGEVFDLIVNRGIAWKPLGPNKVQRDGKVITIDFDVPNPPLVWDTHLPKPHQKAHTAWSAGNGFEVIDANQNEIAIASVAIVDSSVKLTLAAVPADDAVLTVGYAVTPDDTGDYAGRDVDLIGLLRDSDPFEGYSVESIDVQATKGSKDFTAATGALDRRGLMDIATASGLPADTAIDTLNGTTVTLTSAWTGDSGTAKITFRHNHYNYCVHFGLDVP
ncbi:MAG TPA: dockerin [Polyangiaceae bacterium]|nr:dockerin [Polyangiaceae bacterium]